VANGHTPAPPSGGPLTELGLARRFVALGEGRYRYAPEIGRWMVYEGRRWAEDVTGEADRLAKTVVDLLHAEARNSDRREELTKAWLRFQTAPKIRGILELARTEPGVPIRMSELDADPWALNCLNGVVDLRTGMLRPHDPDELHSKLVPVEYDPLSDAPVWRRFLEEVFDGDGELTTFVQRFAGYSLTGDVSAQLMVFGHGAGANGKSTMFGILRRIAGDYAIQLDPTVLTAGQHEQHPTGLTDLRGVRLVTTIETDAGRRLAEALVKQLTGGDAIRARRMRGDYFEFEPSHHLWLAGNHLPQIRGTDHGIWRRIALLPFDVTFEGDRQDPDLPAKLDRESAGILAWAVAGCLAWQREGLALPERVRAATDQYRSSQDHLGRFLDECCVIDETAYVTAKAMRHEYLEWCERQGERSWSAKSVGAELVDRGFDSGTVGRGNEKARTWVGIGLAAP
jgi:putative DNA primase/helicase